ncbi:4Fe-4S binding protein [Methanoculleus sp. UBA303]|uniref:4Fe-4S binding protein n=1 Tax=Methanoculleus sp. UBA303 TaxID=1915497 RepID=UPI0025D389C7|nr:4Fe-4S binding protein [Methanoculleus sp. UBA303]
MEYCKQCAIALKNGISVLDESKCVQCGICVHSCPYHLLKTEYDHYQITVGGRRGPPQTKPCARACRIVPLPSGRTGRTRTLVKRPFPRSNRAWGGTDPHNGRHGVHGQKPLLPAAMKDYPARCAAGPSLRRPVRDGMIGAEEGCFEKRCRGP